MTMKILGLITDIRNSDFKVSGCDETCPYCSSFYSGSGTEWDADWDGNGSHPGVKLETIQISHDTQ